MLEVIRIFGELRKTGWRPLRTIEFSSWFVRSLIFLISANCIGDQPRNAIAYGCIRDGEEYNLIGSTEHVEGRLEDIRRNGLAYCTYLSEHPPVLIRTNTWGEKPLSRAGRSVLVESVS